jgi:hypothetical protein
LRDLISLVPAERAQRDGGGKKKCDGNIFHKNDFVGMSC